MLPSVKNRSRTFSPIGLSSPRFRRTAEASGSTLLNQNTAPQSLYNQIWPVGFDFQKFLIGRPVQYNDSSSSNRSRFNFRSS